MSWVKRQRQRLQSNRQCYNTYMATVFDGKTYAAKLEQNLKLQVRRLKFAPKLIILYFSEDQGSVMYTRLKQQVAERVGIELRAEKLSVHDDVEPILKLVRKHGRDRHIQGVMIQKPAGKTFFEAYDEQWAEAGAIKTLVKNLNYFLSWEGEGRGTQAWWKRLTAEIPPHKDVDCLTAVNLDRVYRGKWEIVPATVRAVLSIIEVSLQIKPGSLMTGIIPSGSEALGRRPFSKGSRLRAVVIGRSEIVGRPLAHVLAQRGMEVSLCASSGVVARSSGSQLLDVKSFEEIGNETLKADIVVSASGKPNLITGVMVSQGTVVIDAGSPQGDVDFDKVKEKASFITPVPGGVGPVTVISLLENLIDLL